MNLGNVEKVWYNVKKATGEYVTCLFKTLASLVYMDDGSTVEQAINNVTSPILLTSGKFSLDSSITVSGIKNLLIISFKNSEEIGRHNEILIPNHDNSRRVSIIESLEDNTSLCMNFKIVWDSNTSATITCTQFNTAGWWETGTSQSADFYTI